MNYNDIEQMIDSKEDYVCKVAYCSEESKIVGFCLGFVIIPEKLQSLLKVEYV